LLPNDQFAQGDKVLMRVDGEAVIDRKLEIHG